jgi:hypothetical protein
MPKYHFSIQTIKDDNSPGPTFNAVVSAANPVDACDEAKKDLLDTFASAGIMLKPKADDSPKL